MCTYVLSVNEHDPIRTVKLNMYIMAGSIGQLRKHAAVGANGASYGLKGLDHGGYMSIDILLAGRMPFCSIKTQHGCSSDELYIITHARTP